MSKLTFPTQAEQALEEFESATKTVSLAKIAKRRGADKETEWPGLTRYVFDDDTSLEVTGRGRAHRVEVRLP